MLAKIRFFIDTILSDLISANFLQKVEDVGGIFFNKLFCVQSIFSNSPKQFAQEIFKFFK
jgi:hypothetical protein